LDRNPVTRTFHVRVSQTLPANSFQLSFHFVRFVILFCGMKIVNKKDFILFFRDKLRGNMAFELDVAVSSDVMHCSPRRCCLINDR
jgi:hypothetical protein